MRQASHRAELRDRVNPLAGEGKRMKPLASTAALLRAGSDPQISREGIEPQRVQDEATSRNRSALHHPLYFINKLGSQVASPGKKNNKAAQTPRLIKKG